MSKLRWALLDAKQHWGTIALANIAIAAIVGGTFIRGYNIGQDTTVSIEQAHLNAVNPVHDIMAHVDSEHDVKQLILWSTQVVTALKKEQTAPSKTKTPLEQHELHKNLLTAANMLRARIALDADHGDPHIQKCLTELQGLEQIHEKGAKRVLDAPAL